MAEKEIEVDHSEESTSTRIINTFINIFSYLLALPIFIIAHKLLPNLHWQYYLDRILLFVATVLIVKFICHAIKPIVIIALIAILAWLSYGTYKNQYGFNNLFIDYRNMLHAMMDSPHPEDIVTSKLQFFPNKKEIKEAIDFQNPLVRNYAVSATTKHFKTEAQETLEGKTIIQSFAVFKEINSHWNYVHDPASREYFAKASETVAHVSGDCDDHSIFMAACIKAIGGTTRLVHTEGHLYPELLVGKKEDIDAINYLIKQKLFEKESKGKQLKFHVDEHNQLWINLDYTAPYPGGEFMDEKILGILLV